MKVAVIGAGLVSSAVLLAFIPSTQALPPWLKPRREDDARNAPRQYYAYGPPGGYGAPPPAYTYGGYGPKPTIVQTTASQSSSSSASATSNDSGDSTSLSSSVDTSGTFAHHSCLPKLIIL